MRTLEYKQMALFRHVCFYKNGHIIYSGLFYGYGPTISHICKYFGLSPDCVSKKVKFVFEEDTFSF